MFIYEHVCTYVFLVGSLCDPCLCERIFVCMSICVCVLMCTSVCVYACTYGCMCMSGCLYVCMFGCMFVCMPVLEYVMPVCEYVYGCLQGRKFMRMSICVNVYVYGN